jgi:DNA-directed RNA polymerase subunit RPC12/RpoP
MTFNPRTYTCGHCGERANSTALDVACWRCARPRFARTPVLELPPILPACPSCEIEFDPYQDLPDVACPACGALLDVYRVAR